MLASKTGFPAVDGIGFAEGQFVCSPNDYGSVAIELLGVYVNRETGMRFGSCPFKGSVFSDKTRDMLLKFLESAEEDVAKALAAPGSVSPRDMGRAEEWGRTVNDVMKGR